MISAICALAFSLTGTYVLLTYNTTIDGYAIAIPFLLCLFIYGVILCLLRNTVATVIVSCTFLILVFITDAFVFQSRYYHIRLSDALAIKDAAKVANQYHFKLTGDQFRIVFIITLIAVIMSWFAVKHPCRSTKISFLVGLSCMFLPLVCFLGDKAFCIVPNELEGPVGDQYVPRLGLAYSWYNQYRNSRLTFPDDYSPEKARSILRISENHSTQPAPYSDAKQPNIVVIMNESLADYSLCSTISFQDPLQFIHDPQSMCFENSMIVSVYGGYTPNTEFEFLTGCSLMFLPPNSIPYTQYMNHDVSSLAWELADLGYQTKAVHPFYAGEYNRIAAYKRLGFQKFLSGDNYFDKNDSEIGKPNLFAFGDEVEYIRGFISDRECFNTILELLDESEESPAFIFAVTIQNHGGYGYKGDDFQKIGFTGDAATDEYLTCSHYTDLALREFTEKLKNSADNTIVLMFGDHQPAVNIGSYINRRDEVSEEALYYIVPYIFWSNYNLKFQVPEIVSANYLSAILKLNAGIPMNGWDYYRLSAMNEYPVISRYSVFDGAAWTSPEVTKSDSLLHEYEIAQDYLLFQYSRELE